MRFIKYLNVDENGGITRNILDDTPNYVSRFYTPQMQVSKTSSNILDIIKTENITEVNTELTEDTVTKKLLDSDLKLMNPYVYQLAQTIVLECFSLIYSLEESPEMMKYIEESDIQQTRENIQYIADCLGDNKDYSEIVTDLHSMDIALGYIQKQVPLIKEELPNYGTIS